MSKSKLFRQKLSKFIDGFSDDKIILISQNLEIFGCTIKSKKIALLNFREIKNKNDYRTICQLIWSSIIKENLK